MTDERKTGSQTATVFTLYADKDPDFDESMETVTRIHIVTELGASEFWADSWRPEVQDDGRTLKLFGKGTGGSARTLRNRALAHDLDDDAISAPLTSREDNE